jgi:hypothetical protein
MPDPQSAAPRVVLVTYPDYGSAQRAVDFLSDRKFPVERTAIVGTDLRMVEQVTGRMTVLRAALAGLAAGGWFGLLIGLLFAIFAVSDWWRVVLAGVFIGAVFGAVFGAVAQAMTGGQRDFSSLRSLQADRYAIMVDAVHVEQARQLLSGLPATGQR